MSAKNNGYIEIYMPNHHKSHKSGYVYEHILIAEEKIGRFLKDEEVVHHINHNRSDNNYENLLVFKTSSDHNRFHLTNTYLLDEEGIAYSPKIENYNFCANCGKKISKKAKLCQECYSICDLSLYGYPKRHRVRNNIKMPAENELYDLIFKYPITKVAEIYGVSDNSIRKWCKKYGLPYKYKDLLGKK